MQSDITNIYQIPTNKPILFPQIGKVNHINNEIYDINEDILNNNEQRNEGSKKKNRKEIYGKGNEAKMIKEEIGDFNAFESMAYKEVTKHFGKSIRLSEIIGILNSIQIYLLLKKNTSLPQISRNEKRSFPLLMKYIERNNEEIFPYFQYISLCNSSFQKIPLDIK